MFRILTSGVLLLVLPASQCESFQTRIKNSTDQNIYLHVTSKTGEPAAFGEVERDNTVDLMQTPSEISSIVYTYGGVTCRLDSIEVEQAVMGDAYGMRLIELHPCKQNA